MKSKNYLKASGSGCTITIEASPSASKTEVTGVNEWRGSLQIKIAAQPRDGAANEELIQFLSDQLSVPKSSIRLIKGEKSSQKMVYVPLSVDKVKAFLGGV